MNAEFKYSIQSLLTESLEGMVSGAMSPLLFAEEMAKQMEMKFNRLARICIDDPEINQVYEADGLTGPDTLLIGCKYKDDLWLSIWVDTGTKGVPVAMAYQSQKEITICPIYKRTQYAKKLLMENIRSIFESIYANPEVIAIQKKSS